jgi:hypothetical protein
MAEYTRQIGFRLQWIAELEAKVAGYVDDWDVDAADGARVFFCAFGQEWSPALDALRTILALKRYIYAPNSPEVLSAHLMVEQALARARENNMEKIVAWPESRLANALDSFIEVVGKAGA